MAVHKVLIWTSSDVFHRCYTARIYIKSIKNTNLAHLFGLNEFRISLALATQQFNLILSFFHSEWLLIQNRGKKKHDLIPDGIFELVKNEKSYIYGVEIDLANETPQYITKHKIQRYRKYLSFNIPIWNYQLFKVIIIAPGVRRLRLLAKEIIKYQSEKYFLLANLECFENEEDFFSSFYFASDFFNEELLQNKKSTCKLFIS